MPEPVPVMLLGRLAVDRRWQKRGLGADLLSDAVLRVATASELIGVRALLVHAASESTKTIYQKNGFRDSPADPMALMITIDEVLKLLGQKRPTR